MVEIFVGIVEDDDAQINSIKRTLYGHLKNNPELSNHFNLKFKSYDINKKLDLLIKDIIYDIETNKIDFIIVDYKIVSINSNTSGVELFNELKKIVREFPAVILTERETECIQTMDVDPDKIYSKKGFFKAKEDYSKDAANKIFNNIIRFSNKKDYLINKISDLKKDNEINGSLENIDEILALEKELSDYYPDGETNIEKTLDKNSLNEIIELIERANSLLKE